MPVIFLVIRIQSVCRKAILICLNLIVAGVSNCDRCYHVYGGITFFEGSAPKTEVKQEISLKKIFGGSQILTILTQLSDEIPLNSLSLHAGKGCSV